jgi:hypothetical protein
MASYCECGHVLAEHFEWAPPDEEAEDAGAMESSGCYGDDGSCECPGFIKVPESELDRGWD